MNSATRLLLSSALILSSVLTGTASETVNDVQSKLNATSVDRIIQPRSIKEVQDAIKLAAKESRFVSIAGGRHAMGGQQFGTGTTLLDMSAMDRVLAFDSKKGLVTVESGIQWPALVQHLLDVQKNQWPQWGIRQKQTGADRLSIGGALSADAHGRGLTMKPISDDVESFTLVDAKGRLKTCSRTQNHELFQLAIGGYGMFGVITTVQLRLSPRKKLERIVEVINIDDLQARFKERIDQGFLYGDFQYSIDNTSDTFMRKGVFSCYRPVSDDAVMPDVQKELSEANWRELYYLAHADKRKAFDRYASYYLTTNGQLYWSDVHQLSVYVDDYHKEVSARMGETVPASEMITEIDVPREKHAAFMEDARAYFLANKVNVIYGTVRLIEKDDEAFLTWAQDSFACTIFNLHVIHNPEGMRKAEKDFRALIDLALKYGGTYFLTYHRFATKEQVMKAYPRFVEFLKLKRKYDPDERFQSDWYRHYRTMFAEELK